MLTLFRQKTFLAGVLVVLVALLLHTGIILKPVPYEFLRGAPFSDFLFSFLQTLPDHFAWSYVISFVLVCLQAFMLNYTVSRHDILYKDTFLPGLMFVVLNSLYPEQLQLTPQLISNTFIILLVQRLCYLYESPNPLLLVFDAGMYLGIGIMFNYDLLLFLPYILISVVIFTSFNLRYIIISLLGIMLPMYFTAVFFYLTDRLPELFDIVKNSIAHMQFFPAIRSYDVLIVWGIILPVAIVAAFNLQQNFFRNKVKTRRILQSTGLLFFFGVLSFFIENTNVLYAICYLSVSLSIIMAYYFISTKRFWIREILFLSLIGVALYFQLK